MKKTMPFDFLLDYLPANVIIKPAIGMYYIYWEKKIVLILRRLSKNSRYNGLWVATSRGDHASLKATIPALANFVFDEGEAFDSAWLLLSDAHGDFETAATNICELISHRDKRIGKVTPKSRSL